MLLKHYHRNFVNKKEPSNITTRNTVLQKLIVARQVHLYNKFWLFIFMFSRASHWSLSRSRRNHSVAWQPLFWYPVWFKQWYFLVVPRNKHLFRRFWEISDRTFTVRCKTRQKYLLKISHLKHLETSINFDIGLQSTPKSFYVCL